MIHNDDPPSVRFGPETVACECDGDPGDRHHPDLAASDLVCQMALDALLRCHALEYARRDDSFYSEGCLPQFLRHPDEYFRPGLE